MISTNSSLSVLPRSVTSRSDVEYALAQTDAGLRLMVCAPTGSAPLPAFEGERSELDDRSLLLCPLTPENAAALRSQLTWLRPRPLGLKTSAGMGDRIGLATPGHVRAVRATGTRSRATHRRSARLPRCDHLAVSAARRARACAGTRLPAPGPRHGGRAISVLRSSEA